MIPDQEIRVSFFDWQKFDVKSLGYYAIDRGQEFLGIGVADRVKFRLGKSCMLLPVVLLTCGTNSQKPSVRST